MDAGKLDRTVVLKHVSTAQDATGEAIRTETAYATVSARRMEQRLGEVFSAGADQSVSLVVWRVRWRADIVATDVLTYAGQDYEVIGEPMEVGRMDYLDLKAQRTGASV